MNGSTPHPVLTERRLAHVHDNTLRRMIELCHTATIPGDRLRLAGVPPLARLEAERRRRERAQEASAS